MSPGTILFDDEFRFHDGEVGSKLFVLLNDGTKGKYLSVKTTSQGGRHGNRYGCQNRDRFPSFFLPRNSSCLNENTWIQLDAYYEFETADLMQNVITGRIKQIGLIAPILIESLRACAEDSYDISGIQVELLR